ncbi:hypothetical protein NDU88_002304 [Pleurodeles waltl]|uniref:Uncharacterized protein n=1 Tax=Pleurodeles waltl TaxID=8319 RepID=A0AAV7RCD1_PLEWA|nr:hypothetical protein NDU88_002304 [Pleurodeles waltl]
MERSWLFDWADGNRNEQRHSASSHGLRLTDRGRNYEAGHGAAGLGEHRMCELKQIEDQLGILERDSISQPHLTQQLREARAEHTQLIERLRKFDYGKYRERAHREGDRAGTLLARLMRDEPSPIPIIQINTPQQNNITTQLEINMAFRDYYTVLYSAPLIIARAEIDSFLTTIELPALQEEARKKLSAQITQGEIRETIKDMARKKAAGSDGLPFEF